MPYANGQQQRQERADGRSGSSPPAGYGDGGRSDSRAPAGGGNLEIVSFEQAAQSCIECHGAKKQEGKFSIFDYQQMPLEEKAKRVWPRLTHSDPDKRMPKGKPQLPPSHLRSFYLN